MTIWLAPALPAPDSSAVATTNATTSMVLGIIGTVYGVLFGFWFPIPALILGIVGLVKYGKAERNGKATAGLVLGIINTSLAGIWFFFVVGFILMSAVLS